ncbi:hypothetical protein RR46_04679 [Papilio xuthus]|uniref:Uncharacterized protein n=1 Tax=Papilio xuthus TaxID=66420 RepID=A0A194PZF9_PAPXU|nr:hypothetical protein RR46_04679 [Papilio xuthus]
MISLSAKLLQQDFDIFHLDILQAIPIMGDDSDTDIKQEIVDTIAYDPKDFDIFHLDILQAIPIMGDDSDTDIKQEIVDTIAYDPKVISKECNEQNEYPKFRRGLKIAEKLRKKRLLVVNNHRRNFTGSGNSSDIRDNNQTRRLESLGEYFDNIMNIKKKQNANHTTTNILNQSEGETKESGSEDLKKQLDSNQPEIEVEVEINEGNDEANSTLNGRRILGIPTIPTIKPK